MSLAVFNAQTQYAHADSRQGKQDQHGAAAVVHAITQDRAQRQAQHTGCQYQGGPQPRQMTH